MGSNAAQIVSGAMAVVGTIVGVLIFINSIRSDDADASADPTVAPTTRSVPSSTNSDEAAALARGQALLESHDPRGAIREFDTAIDSNPGSSAAYTGRAWAKYALLDYTGSAADFALVLSIEPDNAEAYFGQGRLRSEFDLHEEAIKEYDEAIERDPQYVQALLWRARSNSKLGNFEAAISDLDQAKSIEPGNSDVYNFFASTSIDQGEFEKALSYLDTAESLDPVSAAPHIIRGHLYDVTAQYNKSLVEYTAAAALDDKSAGAFQGIAFAHLLLGNPLDAVAPAKRSTELAPSNWWSFNLLGWAQRDSDNLDEARSSFTTSIKLKPDAPDPYSGRGLVLERLRLSELAIADYEKNLQLIPATPDNRARREDIAWRIGQLRAGRNPACDILEGLPPPSRPCA